MIGSEVQVGREHNKENAPGDLEKKSRGAIKAPSRPIFCGDLQGSWAIPVRESTNGVLHSDITSVAAT